MAMVMSVVTLQPYSGLIAQVVWLGLRVCSHMVHGSITFIK